MSDRMTAEPRFGISGRFVGDRPVAGLDQVSAWRFNSQWEMLELSDGSLFFTSSLADNKAVPTVPGTLRNVLKRIEDGGASTSELAGEFAGGTGPEARRRVEKALVPFVRAGILVPGVDEQRPKWADDALVERFSTQLDWLQSLSATRYGHWDFFRRLRDASVTVIGLGGAGSLLAHMLTAAGVGRLHLLDGDTVETSNLVRQILYYPDQAGQIKADCLADKLRRFSPYTEIRTTSRYIRDQRDVADCIEGADMVAVCADAPRFVLNRWIDAACKEAAVPYLGAFAGAVGPMFVPGESACFRCFERRIRDDIGDERYAMVIDALVAKPAWRYPSFVANPVGAAQLLVTEIVLRITGAAPPATIGAVVRSQHPRTVREDFPRHPDCDCADLAPARQAEART